MNRRGHTKLEYANDAFGETFGPGSTVVYYTGNEACLKVGQVARIYDSYFYYPWTKEEDKAWSVYHNIRVVMVDGANIRNKLCMVQGQ